MWAATRTSATQTQGITEALLQGQEKGVCLTYRELDFLSFLLTGKVLLLVWQSTFFCEIGGRLQFRVNRLFRWWRGFATEPSLEFR